MSTATLQELQSDLVNIVHRLSPGQSIVITENGAEVATLSAKASVKPTGKRQAGIWKGKAKILVEDDGHLVGFEGICKTD